MADRLFLKKIRTSSILQLSCNSKIFWENFRVPFSRVCIFKMLVATCYRSSFCYMFDQENLRKLDVTFLAEDSIFAFLIDREPLMNSLDKFLFRVRISLVYSNFIPGYNFKMKVFTLRQRFWIILANFLTNSFHSGFETLDPAFALKNMTCCCSLLPLPSFFGILASLVTLSFASF